MTVVVDYGRLWPAAMKATWKRSSGLCQHCGAIAQHIHHVIPIRLFENPDDGNTDANLVALCKPCHLEAHRLLRAALPKPEPTPLLSFHVDVDLLRRLDSYWHRREFPNRAAAIKRLLDYALQGDPPNPDA